MDPNALIARDATALAQAQTVGANKSFIVIFVITAIIGLFGVLAALVATMANPILGIVVLGLLAVLGGVAMFTKFGPNMTIGVVLIAGLIVAALALGGAVVALGG
jgi:hypothetical protein